MPCPGRKQIHKKGEINITGGGIIPPPDLIL